MGGRRAQEGAGERSPEGGIVAEEDIRAEVEEGTAEEEVCSPEAGEEDIDIEERIARSGPGTGEGRRGLRRALPLPLVACPSCPSSPHPSSSCRRQRDSQSRT